MFITLTFSGIFFRDIANSVRAFRLRPLPRHETPLEHKRVTILSRRQQKITKVLKFWDSFFSRPFSPCTKSFSTINYLSQRYEASFVLLRPSHTNLCWAAQDFHIKHFRKLLLSFSLALRSNFFPWMTYYKLFSRDFFLLSPPSVFEKRVLYENISEIDSCALQDATQNFKPVQFDRKAINNSDDEHQPTFRQ